MIEINVLVFEEIGINVAQGVNFDISSQANTLEELYERFMLVTSLEQNLAKIHEKDFESFIPAPPKEYETLFLNSNDSEDLIFNKDNFVFRFRQLEEKA